MTLDFTLAKYAQLCRAITQLNRPVMTVEQFLRAGCPHQPLIVLRHDVDRAPAAALRMAQLEARLGMRASYYFRTTRAVFKAPIIARLHRLGHEVGYHYEVLVRAGGNPTRAIEQFAAELARFRRLAPVHTISMHGSPLSRWNNLDLWQTHRFERFDLLGDATLSIDYRNLYYFTDTGRSWAPGPFNLRDRPPARQPERPIHATDDLIRFLTAPPACPVIISAHPNRWAAGWPGWVAGAAADWAVNRLKWIAAQTRRAGANAA
ncbi:MAG: hypothetical protein ACE5G8_01640 [Anaerolineae bacterium]